MSTEADDEREVIHAIAQLHGGVLAMVGGMIGGTVIFLMTAWLLVKGGPRVGAHLQLLSHYFYGYSVTWTGSFIGALYGAIGGAIVGWCIGTIYNLVAGLRQ
ncbi:MAG: hypothetical protein ACREQQ_11810 [Candidatus Binatia bacterium]